MRRLTRAPVTAYGGVGQHIANVTPVELELYLKGTVAATLMWPTGTALIKLSVLHFYTTIFSSSTRMLVASSTLALITTLYWPETIIIPFVICAPYAYYWNKTLDGYWVDLLSYYLSIAIVNLLIDVMVVALPLPAIWSLQIATSRKIALTFIFALGFGICAISIARCYGIATTNETDPTYGVILESITTTLEPVLGIVNACLPIIQPVAAVLYSSKPFDGVRHLLSRINRSQRNLPVGDKYSEDGGSYYLSQYNKTPRHHPDDLTKSLC